jgi:dTDP-4-dehydrorhamnose 3,5-epimerase
MQVIAAGLAGVRQFVPTPFHDERGFFTRTFDLEIGAAHGVNASVFLQDSQSRSHRGVIRGMHGRSGTGEAKLVRCARGAILDVVVDIRRGSPTFGKHEAFRLDDESFAHLYIPPGFLHGFQVLSEEADVCYRINRPHDPRADLGVAYDDPDLAISWPLPVTMISGRDRAAGSFAELCTHPDISS